MTGDIGNLPLFLGAGVFLASIVLVHAYRLLALKIGLVDIPDSRKRHKSGTAPVGGLAIFTAAALALPFIPLELNRFHGMYAGLGILLVTGMIDDKYQLAARTKLAMQLLAGVCMVSWEHVTVLHLGDLFGFGMIDLKGYTIPFTLFCLVALINAVNMSDGIDGLAGGITVTALAWLLAAALLGGQAEHILLITILLSATCGFLLFNFRSWWRKSALIFLGDAGSLALGYCLGWFATDLSQVEGALLPPVTVVWILGLPVIDLTTLVIRRISKKQSPFAADRSHLHHLFLRSGFSVRRTAAILVLTSATLGGIGMAGWTFGVPDAVMFYGFIALTIGYNLLAMRPRRLMRTLRILNGTPRRNPLQDNDEQPTRRTGT